MKVFVLKEAFETQKGYFVTIGDRILFFIAASSHLLEHFSLILFTQAIRLLSSAK